MTTLRCSSLDSLDKCPPSVIDEIGAVRINPDSDATEMGKLVHALAGEYVETGAFDLAAESKRRGMSGDEADEAGYLMSNVIRVWSEHKRFFQRPQAERRADGNPFMADGREYQLSGTFDVLSPAAGGAVFLDWKTGLDNGYSNQMFGYADIVNDLLSSDGGAPQVIVGIIAYVRLRKIVTVKYTPDKLGEWKASLIRNTLGRRTYKPGPHCAHCPIWASCAARQQVVSSTFNALMLPNQADPEDASARVLAKARDIFAGITVDNKGEPEVAEGLTQLRFRLKLAEQVIEELKSMERQAVERVGNIPLADGSELTLRAVESTHVEPLKALKVLRSKLSDAEIADAMKLSLPKLMSAVAAKHMRGEKKAAREQLETELDRAGALSVSTHYRLDEVEPEAKELPDAGQE